MTTIPLVIPTDGCHTLGHSSAGWPYPIPHAGCEVPVKLVEIFPLGKSVRFFYAPSIGRTIEQSNVRFRSVFFVRLVSSDTGKVLSVAIFNDTLVDRLTKHLLPVDNSAASNAAQ